MNNQERFQDSLVTFKSIILFTVLTILNISVFVFMVFENQMELITKNAELESKDKGIILKIKIEEIVTGQSTGSRRKRYDVAADRALVYEDQNPESRVLDTLKLKETVFSDYEINEWHRVAYRDGNVGWIQSVDISDHIPSWKTGRLGAEDIRLILNVMKGEGITDYTMFLENGLILADSKKRDAGQATLEEKRLIKKAIFKNSFENLAFYHEVDKDKKIVDLYIPIFYSLNKLFVLRPTIPMRYVWIQTNFLYRQCIIIGIMILLVHILFVIVNQRLIIRPMVRERTDILRAKKRQIQVAKDKLQEAYDELNTAHTIIQDELDVAREIQLAIIPASLPELPDYKFYSRYIPAQKVGGDFYDFYPIDSKNLGIMIADASGHGIPAAFVVSMAKMSFTAHAIDQLSPAKMLKKSNMELEKAITTSHYLTAIYAILHIPTGRITFTRASHPPSVHFHGATGDIDHLDTKGMFVGMIKDGKYQEKQTTIERGDKIVFFTDGINEAFNPEGMPYGKKRLDALIRKNGTRTGKEIEEAIIKDVKEFTRGNPFDDDVTMLILERH
jgi:serine phosphatase RsbU (regulator of sigma subunit)